MRKYIFKKNNYLKFLIILTISFSVVNLVLSQKASSTQLSEKTKESSANDKKPKAPEKKEDGKTDYDVKSNSSTTNNDSTKNNSKLNQGTDDSRNYSQESIQANILIAIAVIELINLIILGLLCNYWFKTRFKNIEQKQNSILGKINELTSINSTVNSLRSNVQETNDRILALQKAFHQSLQELQNSQFKLQESLSKAAFNASHSVPSRQIEAISFNSIAAKNNLPQFVAIYNQDKNALSDRAIAKVSATEASIDSLRNGDSSQIYLEDARSENYWVIEEANINYLIPKKNIKIDSHKLDTVQALFDCSGYYETYSDFQLTKPAKVAKESSGYWRLEERGELSFS
jgi:hypothetical protein